MKGIFAKLHKNRRRGFTLVEVLVAITILGMFSVLLLTVFVGSLSLTVKAGNKDEGVASVAGELEKNLAGVSDTSGLTTSRGTVTITFGNNSTATVEVDKTTGTASTADGTTVTFDTYSPVRD